MSGSCEQRCICLAEGTKRKGERRLLDEGQFVGIFNPCPAAHVRHLERDQPRNYGAVGATNCSRKDG